MLQILLKLSSVRLFHCQSEYCVVVSHCGFNYIFLITNEAVPFICVSNLDFFFCKMLSKSSALFLKIGLFTFSSLIVAVLCIYVFWILIFCYVYYNIYSVAYLLMFFPSVFWWTNVLNFCVVELVYLFLCVTTNDFWVLRNSLLPQDHEDNLLYYLWKA